MSAQYPEEVALFSFDSKAKIHIGGQAVSRYHQLRTFSQVMMFPITMIMIFHLIEPDGFLMLTSSKTDVKIIKYSLDRDIVDTPATGPL